MTDGAELIESPRTAFHAAVIQSLPQGNFELAERQLTNLMLEEGEYGDWAGSGCSQKQPFGGAEQKFAATLNDGAFASPFAQKSASGERCDVCRVG